MAPRQYLDISHFRAPFKNVAVAGFGAVGPAPDGVINATLDPNAAAAINATFEQRGKRLYWRSTPRDAALATLARSGVQPMGDDLVAIIMLDDNTLAIAKANNSPLAIDWVNQKLAEGKAVIAPFWLNMPVTDTSREIVAVSTKDSGKLDLAAAGPFAGILVEPGGGGSGMSTLLKVGLVVGAVVAGVAIVGVMSKRKYTSNRGRRRRPRRVKEWRRRLARARSRERQRAEYSARRHGVWPSTRR